VPTTSAPTVAELADRVVALCETTFAAVDGLRGVADQLLLPFSQGAAPAAADVAPIDGPVRQILDVPRSPLVGAGLVVAPDVLADARHWMQWWTRDEAGRPRQLRPELDAEEESFFDYTVLPWFTVPRDTGRRHVTGPYVDWLCTQEYTLTFTVPVFGTHPERGRCHLGVVGADIVAGWLERRLLPLLHRMDGPVALVNAEGRVVVANRPALVTGAVLRQVDVPALWRRDPATRPRAAPSCTACRTCRSGCCAPRGRDIARRLKPSVACRPAAAADAAPHVVHVQGPDLADQVLEGGGRQGAGLGVEDDTVAHGHHGGDRGDAERLSDLDLGLGVDLAEGDVAVPLRRLLEHGPELAAGAAPRRPEVDEHGAGGVDDAREVLCGQLDGGHGGSNPGRAVGVPPHHAACRHRPDAPATGVPVRGNDIWYVALHAVTEP
jgi:hypothetical protein